MTAASTPEKTLRIVGPRYKATLRRPANLERSPSYEFSDLAVALGVLPGQLRNAIRRAETPPPAPCLINGSRKWYPLTPFKVWWESIGGVEFAVSPRAAQSKVYMESYVRKPRGAEVESVNPDTRCNH